MKSEHIIELIESGPLSHMEADELVTVRAHIADCVKCEEAFAAAQVATVLLREHQSESLTPSPFFNTRVLAAIRERQTANEWSWRRMWRATGALAASMLASVAAVAVLTFVAPAGQSDTEVSLNATAYSAEAVIMNQSDSTDDQVSDSQVLNTLYDAGEEK